MSGDREKIIVAMSGGVDSAVAAGLLIERGFDVTGVFMCLGEVGRGDGPARGCCSPTDAADARRAAELLGIELFVLNMSDFFEPIIENFVDEYARGRTPNPCVHCNTRIKFGRLIERAESLGIARVATGHYARVVAAESGQPCIARGLARKKDQSYALFGIARKHLSRIVLPVGEIESKSAVRDKARSLGLNVSDKPDSQEVCFVDKDDYVSLLRGRKPEALRPGEIVDSSGKVLGMHDGYGQYTIGQRRGLGIAAGEPMYVTRIDPVTAAVTIGPREDLLTRHLSASDANWHCDVEDDFDAIVQIRYNHRGAAGRVSRNDDNSFEVQFAEPISAVTPGQAVVVYDADRMLGGGWID